MADSKKTKSTKKKSSIAPSRKKTDASSADISPAPSAETSPPARPERRSIGVWAMFWGSLLVLLGTLALLDNFNIVEVQFGELWRLWPLAIVAGGIAVLPMKGFAKSVVSVAFVIASLAAVFYVVTAAPRAGTIKQDSQAVVLDDTGSIEAARISVRAGAGEVNLDGNAKDDEVVAADLRSNFATLGQKEFVENGTQVVELALDGSRTWWHGSWENTLDVSLGRELPTELTIDSGAAAVVADLRNVVLTKLDLRTGASSVELTLGGAAQRTEVELSAGASSIVVRVPRNAGVRAKTSGALSSSDFAGLSQVGEYYQTEGFDDADTQITIEASIAAASFTLERY
jgi:hypothetical protein